MPSRSTSAVTGIAVKTNLAWSGARTCLANVIGELPDVLQTRRAGDGDAHKKVLQRSGWHLADQSTVFQSVTEKSGSVPFLLSRIHYVQWMGIKNAPIVAERGSSGRQVAGAEI